MKKTFASKVFASKTFAVSTLSGAGSASVSPAYESQRHTLYGTSLQRHALKGQQ